MSSETLYVVLFIATFPALWILAAAIDHFLPDQSPHQERPRNEERQLLSGSQKRVPAADAPAVKGRD